MTTEDPSTNHRHKKQKSESQEPPETETPGDTSGMSEIEIILELLPNTEFSQPCQVFINEWWNKGKQQKTSKGPIFISQKQALLFACSQYTKQTHTPDSALNDVPRYQIYDLIELDDAQLLDFLHRCNSAIESHSKGRLYFVEKYPLQLATTKSLANYILK